jgi:anti-sigma regulatory factor (Ser/Thr protein kinase)
MSGSDETGLIQLTVALREALLNAMEHGNLELDSKLRDRDDDSYHRLARQRRAEKPFADRKVHVQVRETPNEARYIIRDEGPGFDTANIPDPTIPENLEKCGGRGLLLMRTFMAEVSHNEKGNEVTLVWRSNRA